VEFLHDSLRRGEQLGQPGKLPSMFIEKSCSKKIRRLTLRSGGGDST
jgi:hypothetical protein